MVMAELAGFTVAVKVTGVPNSMGEVWLAVTATVVALSPTVRLLGVTEAPAVVTKSTSPIPAL